MLVANAGDVRPAFASHNARSIAWALCAARAGRAARTTRSKCKCCTAWPNRCTPPSRNSESARASTCRSAIWCREWRTSYGACSRTRRTSRSCAIATPRVGRSTRSSPHPTRRRAARRAPVRTPPPDRSRRTRAVRQRAAGRAPPRRDPQPARRSGRPRRTRARVPGVVAHRRRGHRHPRVDRVGRSGPAGHHRVPQRVGGCRARRRGDRGDRRTPVRNGVRPRGASAPGSCSEPRT